MVSLYRSSSDTVRRLPKDLLRADQCPDQDIHFVSGVVDVEAGPRRTAHVERVHQDLTAMVSRPDRDPLVVDHLPQVVRMNVVDVEGDHTAPPLGLWGAVDRHTGQAPELLEGIAG